MEIINFDNVWRTFIKSPSDEPWENEASYDEYIYCLTHKLKPLISNLQNESIIKWFCFLFHEHPQTKDLCIDIHLETIDNINLDDHLKLYSYCFDTRKAGKKYMEEIGGIESDLLRDCQIEKAWQVIGEVSVWILNMISIHSKLTRKQTRQFLHYFHNALQCPGLCWDIF